MPIKPRIIIDYELETANAVESLIRRVSNLHSYFRGEVVIEVMTYGPGIKLLMKNNQYADELIKLAEAGATFVACQNTMKRIGLDKEQLLDQAAEAPSGLGHIVDRQLEGWAYLKM